MRRISGLVLAGLLLAGQAQAEVVPMSLSPSGGSDTASGSSVSSTRSNSVSADGRFAVFVSTAPNLVPGQVDTNQAEDVFLFDAQTNAVTLISHIPGDPLTTGNSWSFDPVISADGQRIAFVSGATNLVTGADDNGGTDIFAWNAGVVSLVSHVPGNEAVTGDLFSLNPVISADGLSIVFESWATNLIAGFADNNGIGNQDIFCSNGGVVSLVSHVAGNTSSTANGVSYGPVISTHGQRIAFASAATDLVVGTDDNERSDVFLAESGITSLVSHVAGSVTTTGNHSSFGPMISADGQSVAFGSFASDLVTGFVDNNGGDKQDVFISNAGVVSLLSHIPENPLATGNGDSFGPVVSADGQSIAFSSLATDLVAGFIDRNGEGNWDIFVLKSGVVSLVSHVPNNSLATANRGSFDPVISSNGQSIVFLSWSTDLVAGTDNNGQYDVFVAGSGIVNLVSHVADQATVAGNDLSGLPAISGDGSRIIYSSLSANLEAGFQDGNGTIDVLDYTVSTATNRYVSRIDPNASPLTGQGDSFVNSDPGRKEGLSADGRFAVFVSSAPNLVPGQTDLNNAEDIFLFDAHTNSVTLVSHVPGNPSATGNRRSFDPVISANGQSIAFVSDATDLVTGTDSNDSDDVFASLAGVVSLVSHIPGSATTTGNSSSYDPVISADGQRIAFVSYATNLVTGFVNGNGDIHVDVFDWNSGVVGLVSHVPGNPSATGNSGAFSPVISSNGQSVAFLSPATDLVTGFIDNNADDNDVFVAESGVLSLVSHRPGHATSSGNRGSGGPVLSADGKSIAFASVATDLVTGTDRNEAPDVFLSRTGLVSLVSHARGSQSTTANNSSFSPVISADGQSIAFASGATDLVTGTDSNGWLDIFVFESGSVSLVSHVPGNPRKTGNNGSLRPVISANGQSIAFESFATDLVFGTDNNEPFGNDVFVSNAGVVNLVSHVPGSTTTAGNYFSSHVLISANGSAVIFDSVASDLSPFDGNVFQDAFYYRNASARGGGGGGGEEEDDDQDFGIGAIDPFLLLLVGLFGLWRLAYRRRQRPLE